MTTYTGIANSEVDGDSPITDTLMQRLRDNVLAMFEGAAGAPRLQLAALDTWFTTAGAVGTYVFATRTTGTADVAFGSTLAGSSLSTVGASWDMTSLSAPLTTGSTLSGTWQCMGNYDHANGGTKGATLWLRTV